MNKIKISTMLFTWNGVGDRFLKSYFEPKTIDDIIPEIAQSSILKGIEVQHPNHVSSDNVELLKDLLTLHNLVPVIVNIPMSSDIRWKRGSFSSPLPDVRKQAVERVKNAVDVARKLGTTKVSLFMGQDGFDYPLTSDYQMVWQNLKECFIECADYAPDIQFCIEYKPFEPRTHQFFSSSAKVLLFAEETGRSNIGLLVDIGHAWMAGENMGEVICLSSSKNRLFHIHFNDNYQNTDDDLGVGGIHFTEFLEALYWIRKVDYQGWISLDVHSPRENSFEIINESAKYLYQLNEFIDRVGIDEIKKVIDSNDGSKLIRFINTNLL